MLDVPVLASQEGRCLFFKWTFFVVSEPFSSILTADIQHTLGRPQKILFYLP